MRTDHWILVTTIAARQRGLVTRAQVLAAGASPRSLHRAVARGRLVPFRRQVYRIGGTPDDPWQPLLAACLAGAPGAVASHRAAAGLHGLPGVLPGAVEVTVERAGRRTLAGVRCHTSVALAPADATIVHGVPATTVARTIVDLAPVLHPRLLGRITDDAWRRGLCSPADVAATLDRIGGPGRAGAARLARLLADHEPTGSTLETTWLRRLRRSGLAPEALQHQVVVAGRVMVMDLAWPGRRVGVEVDGWAPHGTRSAWDRDHDKINAYAEAGWRVLFVTSRTSPAATIRQLSRLLRE